MKDSRDFFNTPSGLASALAFSTLAYFLPCLFYKKVPFASWAAASSLVFIIIFVFYYIVPSRSGGARFSAERFSFLRAAAYSAFIFGLCFLFYGPAEKFFAAKNIKNIEYSIFSYVDSLSKELERSGGGLPPMLFTAAGFFTGALLPFFEEYFFRGYVQREMKKYFSLPLAVMIPSALVGLRHLALFFFALPFHYWPAFFVCTAAFASFCIFGYIYEIEEDMAYPVAAHLAGNVSFLACLKLFAA